MNLFPALLACLTLSSSAAYDPLALPEVALPAPRDLTVTDAARNREIPVRVQLPVSTNASPVVVFSHGLGGSRENNGFMARHWAARGYAVVNLQHPGSDESVWKEEKGGKRLTAMREAANASNYLLRLKDVPAALDQLAKWNAEPGHALRGRLDLDKVGMSGHSFGALTTQGVSGQQAARGRISFTEPRIDAAVMFSPSTPTTPGDHSKSFAAVKIPWLLLTGTKDVSIIGGATVEHRLGVFPLLPSGSKYELVLHNAEHSAFSERPLPGDKVARNPNHHRLQLALTTAFWDAHLRQDPDARAWLDGTGPDALLEKEDRWRRK
jgi:predicted dienelactone hydrolase